jgi:hypothetical protein
MKQLVAHGKQLQVIGTNSLKLPPSSLSLIMIELPCALLQAQGTGKLGDTPNG